MQDRSTMKTVCLLIGLTGTIFSAAQPLTVQLNSSLNQMEKDEQFRHSILSLYVIDSKTGAVVFDKNSRLGLAPASCQKIVISASAFELLGHDYVYRTPVMLYHLQDSQYLFIAGSGDPTLGSWRWPRTKMNVVCSAIIEALNKRHIRVLGDEITMIENKFVFQPVPDGWIWQDIGNYYGAGARTFNWHENQYDLILGSGNNEGDSTEIKAFEPSSARISLLNFITTGRKGSGDNAYIYPGAFSSSAYATGTIPPEQNRFVISGAMPFPEEAFIRELKLNLNSSGIRINNGYYPGNLSRNLRPSSLETILELASPPLDSINFWFLKKSVNLFGEALVKTISSEKAGMGSTDTGINIIKDFWGEKGIERSELNISDGCGLSPANRVTGHALTTIMQYARKQIWFPSFLSALPEINGLKMKDGYISGVRSFTGYVKSRNGNEYCFSFIVNNFDGSPATVREKMWKVLDILK